MVQIEYLPLVLTGIGLIVSIIYYASVLKNQSTTRNAQFFMEFAKNVHSPEKLSLWVQLMRYEWDDLADFEKKYGSVDNPDDFGERYSFWTNLNNMGWLFENGVIKVEDVNALIGPMLYWTWEKFEPIILEHRRVYNFPDQYCYWERLSEAVISYRKKEKVYMETPENYDDYLSSLNP